MSERKKDAAGPAEKSRESRPAKKECRICKGRLPTDYDRPTCESCIDKMVAAETPNISSILSSMKDLIKEEIQKSLVQVSPAVAPVSAPNPATPSTSQEAVALADNEFEEGVIDEIEAEYSDDELSGKPLFSVEDVDTLVKEVRSTMEIEEQKEQRSVQDIMFSGLESKKRRVFPVHRTISALINREWAKPDRKGFIPRAVKRKYPFDEKEVPSWEGPPKIDAAIAKVSKRSQLPFEDLGTLKDPMDKKADGYLKKAWESSTATFKPNVAGTCVARSMLVWLTQLEDAIKAKESEETILSSLAQLKKSTSFLADASADALRFSARSAASSNSARRAIWLKNWSGDAVAKAKICSFPCEGEFLFGSELDKLLEKAGDRKKGFPSSFQPNAYRFFRPQSRGGFSRRGSDRGGRGRGYGKSRGYLFNQKSDTYKKPSTQ
ncbi:lamina-associated polypeptide 2-like [Dendropsophus ebraccatus]|uniref:lamina-associated polypeptide 2-like n=1 Tax=Dendropsophus ebraccatus TaxID=150705 RepID=UPI003830FFE5